MTRTIYIAISLMGMILAFFPARAWAQTTGSTEDVHRLTYLNSLYIQSFIRSDTATYNKLLWASEFTQQNPDGSRLNRAQCMVRFGKPRFETIVYFYAEAVEVKFISPDKAVIHARTPYAIQDGAKLSVGVSQYNDTYVRKNGVWKCVSAEIWQ